MNSVYSLVPSVQHYDWGGTSFIPSILGLQNPEGRPFAELWMGAHPTHPSFVRTDGGIALGLDGLIAQNPEIHLGRETLQEFGGLPFLFKVLDVAKPLSIQVHPGRDQARAGFDEEEGQSVSPLAPFRKYKDPFSKPELVMAMDCPFWALAGFRPVDEIKRLFSVYPEMGPLSAYFSPTLDGIKSLYGRIMSASQTETENVLRPLLGRLTTENNRTPFPKEDPRFWVLKANAQYSSPGAADRGLFSILLMNLLKLNPGESLFLPPGVLHSFLEGVALEISANSDNVFRGGLTHKPVDVPDLLKTVVFDGTPIEIQKGIDVGGGESIYSTHAKEFELRRFHLRKGGDVENEGRLPSPALMAYACSKNDPRDPQVNVVDFGIGGDLSAQDEFGKKLLLPEKAVQFLKEIQQRVANAFNGRNGFFGGLVRINFLDGLRLQFGNRDVVHIRPSGNAPQMRIYACADTFSRVQEIVRLGLQEPAGFLLALADGIPRERI